MRTIPVLVLALSLSLGACSDVDPEAADSSPDGNVVTVTGTDPLAWNPAQLSAAPGEVELVVECGLTVDHEFAIEDVRGGETLVSCDAASVGTDTIELDAGTYTFFCNVPGHRDQGMVGELTVEE